MSTDRTDTGTTLDRLRAVLDAYGAEPARWPASERDALASLVAASAEARRLQADAARLDSVLDALPAAMPAPGLEDRILAAARSATTTPRVASLEAARAQRDASTRRRGGWLAAALPLAAAAALAAWLVTGSGNPPAVQVAAVPVADPDAPLTLDAELTELALAELGVYEMPGDELLGGRLDDVYEAAPLDGCTSGELGCLEVDTLPLDPVSQDEKQPQEVRRFA